MRIGPRTKRRILIWLYAILMDLLLLVLIGVFVPLGIEGWLVLNSVFLFVVIINRMMELA